MAKKGNSIFGGVEHMSQSYVIMRLHTEPRPGPILRCENICLIPGVSANQLFDYQVILKALSPFGSNLLIRVHFPVQIQRENQYHCPLESHHAIRIRKEIALQYDFSYKIQRSCEMANLFFLLFPSLLPILPIYSHDIGLIGTGQDYESAYKKKRKVERLSFQGLISGI
jgi:hypothetical protein